MRIADVIAVNDVPTWITGAVRSEMEQAGFTVIDAPPADETADILMVSGEVVTVYTTAPQPETSGEVEGQPAIPEKGRMSEAALRSVLPGAALRGTSARGNAITVTDHRNGPLSGLSGANSDTGRWAIQGNTVCTTWSKWRNAERRCFYFIKDGDGYTAYFSGTNELNAMVTISRG
ncbi:MAG: hypothetical protein O7G83_06320 [Proteobacteria bacterium]|nr:hypothetical protein [Pseudomonadota bacterium]